ncbi:hypothetical protein [Bordetella bronchiseptica]|uniref:hypothetical protein n=1 Tax=Bordetella bronchiseptica TaxID=518 RepID=UPI00190FA2FE|nr:hypothetical protein [Bordetella bronchiseptica]
MSPASSACRYRPIHVDALDQRYRIQPGLWQSATPRKNAIDDAVAIIDGIKCGINESDARLTPLYCKQDIFIFYIQWLIFLLIGNTMKNTMLRKGLTIF